MILIADTLLSREFSEISGGFHSKFHEVSPAINCFPSKLRPVSAKNPNFFGILAEVIL